jgi:hypothetical protein
MSNGGTEAINGVIEKTRRLAHGFRNFTNYRISGLGGTRTGYPWPCSRRTTSLQPEPSAQAPCTSTMVGSPPSPPPRVAVAVAADAVTTRRADSAASNKALPQVKRGGRSIEGHGHLRAGW